MTPQGAKQKGRLLQQWVRDKIIENNPGLTTEDVRSTSMGNGGEDVQLSPRARELFPFQVECKSKSQVAVYSWYDQASEHGTNEPLLIIKENGRRPLAILDATLLIKIIKDQYGSD